MATFNILIGADVRAYCQQEAVEAESREEAIAKTVAWLEQRGQTPERIGFAVSDEEGSEIQGDVSIQLSADGVDYGWLDLPTWDGQPRFADLRAERDRLLDFARQMARFTTPEDDFANLKETYGVNDDGGVTLDGVTYDDVEEMLADMSDDRLMDEYSAFCDMIRQAREIVAASPPVIEATPSLPDHRNDTVAALVMAQTQLETFVEFDKGNGGADSDLHTALEAVKAAIPREQMRPELLASLKGVFTAWPELDTDDEIKGSDAVDWLCHFANEIRPLIAMAEKSRPKRTADDFIKADQALFDASEALYGALKAMRQELDKMSGQWTERMATLAQMADAAIAAAEGR